MDVAPGRSPMPSGRPYTRVHVGSANWKRWLFLKQILESRHEVGRKRGHGGEVQVQNELGAESWEWMGKIKIHGIHV